MFLQRQMSKHNGAAMKKTTVLRVYRSRDNFDDNFVIFIGKYNL